MDAEILELENTGLRYQNKIQQEKLLAAERELRLLRRFKNLVDRAGEIVDRLAVNIPVV